LGEEITGGGFEAHGCTWDRGAGWVDDRTAYGRQVLRVSQGGYGRNEDGQQASQVHGSMVTFEA